MKIEKIINNNVVCSRNAAGNEIVIMGKGIGFQAKPGNLVDQNKIEKVFHIENPTTVNQFTELLANIPFQHIQLSNDIISHAKKKLNTRLNQNVYVTLTDHINFAIVRYREGIKLSNALLMEIKRFYREEFQIGEYAVHLINEKLHLELPEDEAGFIALHIVNAEYDTNLSDTVHITNMIQEVLAIVKDFFDICYDEQSLHYERFVTHIKFLAQRIFRRELMKNEDDELIGMMAEKYPKEFACAEKIAASIAEGYHTSISKEEILYMAVHIRRVTMQANIEKGGKSNV